jgi:hypothetical protein
LSRREETVQHFVLVTHGCASHIKGNQFNLSHGLLDLPEL